MKGARLMLLGRYDEALAKLARESKRAIENLNSGPVCTIGCVYLLQGQFAKAEKHFLQLMQTTAARLRCSDHYLYAGTARWFLRDPDGAEAYWHQAMKAHYAGHEGIDALLHLMYMSKRSPRHFRGVDYEPALRKEVTRMSPESKTTQLARFVLGDINVDEARRFFSDHVAGKYAHVWLERFNSSADFHEAADKVAQGDRQGFRRCLECCVRRSESDDYQSHEYIFARLELRQMNMRQKRSRQQ